MVKTFDEKIRELENIKSELDLSFLYTKKQEYEEGIYEILDNRNNKSDNCDATSILNKAAVYRVKIREINEKIQENPKLLEDIQKKIAFYQERKEKVKDIKLYRETEEWISEILWSDSLYQYAKEIKNEELINKLERRSLTENEYSEFLGKMYEDLFPPILEKDELEKEQPHKRVRILLPEWMTEQIEEELKDNKDITPQNMKKFLVNELKKNAWEIKISHIKNTFKDNWNEAYQYVKKLITNYSGFKIIENSDRKSSSTTTQSKREKLISSISKEGTEEHKNERLRRNNLLFKLNEIWKIEDLKSRISKYCDLFEELECKFANRGDFEPLIFDVIKKYNNIGIEKDIKKTLNLIIQDNPHTEKTWLYRYIVYKFNRDSRRMLAYPNWEIFGIYPHVEYEKIINTQPPADKVE